MCQHTVRVVPLFTVVLDLNVPTHNNDGATVHHLVGSNVPTHNNGSTIVHCCVGSECANSQ